MMRGVPLTIPDPAQRHPKPTGSSNHKADLKYAAKQYATVLTIIASVSILFFLKTTLESMVLSFNHRVFFPANPLHYNS